jgi:hypothetical protein
MKNFIAILLVILAIITAFISTRVTIIPIAMEFKGGAKSVVILMYSVLQITMFLIALVKFTIKKATPQHYIFIIRIQKLLFAISILGTMSFFNMSRAHIAENKNTVEQLFNIIPFIDKAPFYTWLVDNVVYFGYIGLICVLLDLVSLKLPTIAYDLAYGLKDEAIIDTFWSKLGYLLTYRVVNKVNTAYNEAKNIKPVLPEPEPIQALPEPLSIEEKVIDTIKTGPDIVATGYIREQYNLGKKDWEILSRNLIDKGIIIKRGTKYTKEAC